MILFKTNAGYPVEATEHALQRARLRTEVATMDALADDLRRGSAMGKGKDGLEAFRGASGAVYMLRFEGLRGCRPVRATVVSVLEPGTPMRGHGWRPCPARSLHR